MTRLVICAKSTWDPAIRREHELARLAVRAGHEIVFAERPRDVRLARTSARAAWARELRRPRLRSVDGVTVARRSTLVPAHRSRLAGRVDHHLLATALRRLRADVVVATVPWEWPAVSPLEGARRVFDCADDWSQILPDRRDRIRALCRRIGREADAIVCVSEHLAELFAPGSPVVVRNGTPAVLLERQPAARPRTTTMVYAGTLSERFDAPFVDAVLRELPEWRVELYGQAQYAGRGGEPDAELATFLARWPDRAVWHGSVPRDRLGDRLDKGDVLVIPHRRRGAVDGDWMKFYDYAARGRPVATTESSYQIDAMLPPHTYVATTPAEFAAAVKTAASEPDEYAGVRRRWAEANAWQSRWDAWSKVVLD